MSLLYATCLTCGELILRDVPHDCPEEAIEEDDQNIFAHNEQGTQSVRTSCEYPRQRVERYQPPRPAK